MDPRLVQYRVSVPVDEILDAANEPGSLLAQSLQLLAQAEDTNRGQDQVSERIYSCNYVNGCSARCGNERGDDYL